MMAISALSPVALAAIAGGGALLLAAVAALLLHAEARQRDFAVRIRQVTRPSTTSTARPTARGMHPFGLALQRLGEALRRTALFSAKDIVELERAVAAAGFNPHRAVSTFLGVKLVTVILLPVLGWFVGEIAGGQMRWLLPAVGVVLGILVPGWVVAGLRRPYVAALERGLPDALDLLVVCAESGLGLDSAVERVAREVEFSNPAIAVELAMLSQELRMLPDRRDALMRLGERTGVESFQRLAATLSQTLRYGTPLAQALRVLAAEMRQERMTQLEERAARLPALLVLPLVLFILPCLFIILIGPSAIRLVAQFSGS